MALFDYYPSQARDFDPQETNEWIESIDSVIDGEGGGRARYLLQEVVKHARQRAVPLPALTGTDYINTIPPHEEPEFPGEDDYHMEKRIRRITRWNAMAMVTRANKRFDGLGGHISTYASTASMYEVGLNHFFRGRDHEGGGDQIFFQGHGAPGVYARAYLEGRLTEDHLDRFRREVSGQGLSSYPHPWLMPDFWQFPTVSMGLGPIAAIYQARFNRYLHNRGLKDTSQQRVWCFIGDGESDEVETTGALSVAAREGLDNLVFVVNCNLQRLDGPVRGNGKIIQELEGRFRGAGWHVIKVIWGEEWDPLFAADRDGALVKVMNETVDGEFQKFSIETGAYVREHFFGKDPRLLQMVESMSDVELRKLRRGGHSYRKLYAGYKHATEFQDGPTVILAKTVKGWTLGEGFLATNATHQQKKLDTEQLKTFRDTLELDISDGELEELPPYYHPGPKAPEIEYLHERRRILGGPIPMRRNRPPEIGVPADDLFAEFKQGAKAGVEVSTTVAMVRLLRKLLRDPELGPFVVPIVPDEARTFGMDSLFREVGIYAAGGQKYEPVDAKMLLHYHEAQDGQLLQEGITEAGSMASFTAAATSYATHGTACMPFYLFYSMFGFQRTMDQIWALGDQRGRGFLLGATAGRTTLNGEGLQHEDGHSLLLAQTVPNCISYDPAFAYETAAIVRDGLRRMLDENEDVFYYITLYNENYAMPPMPEGVEDGILKGLYRLAEAPEGQEAQAQIFGSGPLIHSALSAQQILHDDFGVPAVVWSVTSYPELFRDARASERETRLNPESAREAYLTSMLKDSQGPIVTTQDWVSELPSLLSRFVPNRFLPLGTNGFGRSDTREELREFFEINAAHVAYTVLYGLHLDGELSPDELSTARDKLGIKADAPDPFMR
ncbi:MAG: pyruvate dehydrogenase (acetyl-transferring), homodimeric type [Myxococcota bacterium]